MPKKSHIERKRANRLHDAYVLFVKHKITMHEYKSLIKMINSPDEENLHVAQSFIQAKNVKKKKDNQ